MAKDNDTKTIYQRWHELNVPERNGWFGERFDVTLEPEMLTRNVADLAIEHREFYEYEHKDKSTTKQWQEMLTCWIAYRRESEEVDV